MSSTRITNKRINNFTIAFNATIESMVAIGIINNSDAIFFRKMFIKIRTDTAILNALSNCNIIIFFNLQIIEYKFHGFHKSKLIFIPVSCFQIYNIQCFFFLLH